MEKCILRKGDRNEYLNDSLEDTSTPFTFSGESETSRIPLDRVFGGEIESVSDVNRISLGSFVLPNPRTLNQCWLLVEIDLHELLCP